MADNKNNISFSLLEIKTDQFALFEENHIENGKIRLSTNLTFGFNPDESVFLISVKYIFEMRKKPFMTIQASCFFMIDKEALKDFKNINKTIFPKGFVAHMAMITVGTSRGILHTKTEGTIFNKYILPTIDVAQLIPEDITFE
jgi:hypothetical protein